ncbi:TIGR00730 family Rossman fold protein [Trinickia sp. NRRL B-1857]|uniref:LOG family protein n=1 Tax=Trinickia sp. NRRL B-1857 TaxID=3162879 RepID=UPI003D29BC6F
MYSEVVQELRDVHAVSARLGTAISIFGSARVATTSSVFELAREVAYKLAILGYAVISGGGPGIMRAALEGARAGGSPAIGFNIKLPFEPLDVEHQDISLTFEHFFTRKFAFCRCSDAFVIMPGGMGTLDELFEILTLMQTGKLEARPVALVGSVFWGGLLQWLRTHPVSSGLIAVNEIDSIGICDNADEVVAFLSGQLSD